ncbi:hypothetical protein DPMN_058318 [Dreissena polymorpha]|uniref:Uncharacterized protein n=1 Tax=Dreissena polymorpha TaxID=45954 RepID=A0A9D4C1T6_DREPO|nr:hypothetical protein DPMN_058318 [Dreissena polymorpha]
MASALLHSLPGTGQDVDHVAPAMRQSSSDQMALAILQSLPEDVIGHIMTSPFTGDRYSPWHRGLVMHRSPVLPGDVTGHVMTGPVTGH